MVKRILLIVGIAVLVLLLIEVVAVLHLKGSVDRYASYWQQRSKETGEFTYVALGDSAAQGIGTNSPDKGYVGILAAQIQAKTHKTVRVVNLSVTGARIEDVLNKQLPEMSNYHPDLVTIEIGANDVASGFSAPQFSQRFNLLASKLPKGTIVSNMPYFGGRIRHNAEALVANQIIAKAAQANALPLANLQAATKTHNSLLDYGSDYFHPSNRGYKNWAAAFWQAIEKQL